MTRRRTVSPAPVASLDGDQVLAWRLRRQHLECRAPEARTLGVVADIAGLHAQVMSSAELTLWARVEGLAPSAVARDLWEDRRLVKTWAMRGTLHLLPAAELPLWCAAQGILKPRHHAPSWLRFHGLTRPEADAMLAAIPVALDGHPLTREELADAVARLAGVDHLAEKLRGGFGDLLKPAAFRGDLCFAPSLGQQVRFTRPDRWLPAWEPVDTERAAQEVARRYLAAYGPATRDAFARWFGGASPAQAERLFRSLGDAVATVDVAGEPAWMLAADVADVAAARPRGVVRLLPAFDQYVVTAPRAHDAVLPAAYRERVYRPQGWLSPVLLVDGRIEGTWRHERKGDRVTVEIAPFGDPPAATRRAAEEEAARLAAFLVGNLDLRWDT